MIDKQFDLSLMIPREDSYLLFWIIKTKYFLKEG